MKNTYILLLALFSFIAIQAQVDRTVMPTPGPAPEVNLGTPQSFKLNNGLKQISFAHHHDDDCWYPVSVRVCIHVSAANRPDMGPFLHDLA